MAHRNFHRHALMTMIGYAFLQHRRLAATAPKKRTNGPPPQPFCPPCATPFSNFSLDYRRSDARIVENGFAASSGVSKSAKVVLERGVLRLILVDLFNQIKHTMAEAFSA
jgi:hypothetical protein